MRYWVAHTLQCVQTSANACLRGVCEQAAFAGYRVRLLSRCVLVRCLLHTVLLVLVGWLRGWCLLSGTLACWLAGTFAPRTVSSRRVFAVMVFAGRVPACIAAFARDDAC